MNVRIKANEYRNRERLILGFVEAGLKVWVEKERKTLYRSRHFNFYVCFEYEPEEKPVPWEELGTSKEPEEKPTNQPHSEHYLECPSP